MPVRVLIVDDEPIARRGVRMHLSGHCGYEIVGECGSGIEAVIAIRSRRPDLVFLDVQMPELDGFGVIDAVGPGVNGWELGSRAGVGWFSGACGSNTDFTVISTPAADTAAVELTGKGTCAEAPVKSAVILKIAGGKFKFVETVNP